MARPSKQGLDYYPYDVDADQDDKLGMIIAEFNVKGELFWLKLLSWIYKNEGYYTEWNEDAQLRFLRRYNYCGFSVGFIQEVVPRLIKWGLLDQAVFSQFHILTSKRIQNTWYSATRKRKCKVQRPEIWIHEVIGGNKAEETGLIPEETTQRKRKEIKEKENRDISIHQITTAVPTEYSNPPPSSGAPPSNGPPIEQVKSFFRLAGGTEEMAEAFWNKYEALDWKQGQYGTKIANWCPMANGYIATWRRNEQKNGTGKQTTAGSISTIDAATAQLLRDINAPGSDR